METAHENASAALRLVIIGGVAAGASCAARARRLSERAHITLLERGPDISFANCGLPYHIGGEIARRDALLMHTPQTLRALLNIDIQTGAEAVEIDRAGKRVAVRPTGGGDAAWLPYDKLLLAPGAAPLRPPLPGLDDPRVLTLRNLPDMDRINAATAGAKSAVIVGAGFIGLEMAEQLHRRGLKVRLVEMTPQVLPQLDAKMTLLLRDELERHGVELHLGDGLAGVRPVAKGLAVRLASGREVGGDFVVLSIGVRPDTGLARAAGLVLGPRGHIVVDAHQRTSDRDIYAAGDAVETADRMTGQPCAVPLGGPANRQGRIAADHIFRGAAAPGYRGSIGTAIVRAFGVSAGLTGWTERRLQAAGRAYRTAIVNDNHHAGYYPGAQTITLKIVWDAADGRLLGAQATGGEGVDKRLDVLATAIAGGLRAVDLADLELSYAPPFGSAKDVVNLAGFAAQNLTDGLLDTVDEIPADGLTQVVDVRPGPLFAQDPLPGARNIPLPTLRARLGELDPTRPVVTVCAQGRTSYFAARILSQNGFQVRSLTGGIKAQINPRIPAKLPTP